MESFNHSAGIGVSSVLSIDILNIIHLSAVTTSILQEYRTEIT